jgi:lipopolysaccharide transport system ATP-binding protein
MSSNNIAIRVTNLSKCYEIYSTPFDRLKQFLMPRLQGLAGLTSKQYFREFWALNDISFTIKKGETVGIIGRNGSGKSTLLQMICGTLTPTSGSIQINGRIAALLELGSGFNPEFTGRENVYLNASVLGLSNEEIDKRFSEIVTFADIGDFIEQPVKTYSSGMMVRLAFAVIANVDADILVIDEALAVGDAFFTQKCMRFLRNFMQTGTVIFVSHDLASVKNLCNRAVWLNQGLMAESGKSEDVCNAYLKETLKSEYSNDVILTSVRGSELKTDEEVLLATSKDFGSSSVSIAGSVENANGWTTGLAEITDFIIENLNEVDQLTFRGGDMVKAIIKAKAISHLSSPMLGFIVKDKLGQELFGQNTVPFTTEHPRYASPGQILVAEFVFRMPNLQNGQYPVMISLANGDTYNHIHHHYLYDATVINIYASSVRLGIMTIPFESICLEVKAC